MVAKDKGFTNNDTGVYIIVLHMHRLDAKNK